MTGFVCLMASGLYISEDLGRMLIRIGFQMLDAKDARSIIKTEYCEGEVTTRFRYAALGVFGGVRFDAKIEMGWKVFEVRYIVDPDMKEHVETCVSVDLNQDESHQSRHASNLGFPALQDFLFAHIKIVSMERREIQVGL